MTEAKTKADGDTEKENFSPPLLVLLSLYWPWKLNIPIKSLYMTSSTQDKEMRAKIWQQRQAVLAKKPLTEPGGKIIHFH